MLLLEKGLKPPYLLVSHSFGGAYIRSFASQYPISRQLTQTDFNECDQNPLPDVPVYFIMAGGFSSSEPPTIYNREKMFRINENIKMKRYLQLLYPLKYGKLFYSSSSSHFVQTDEPELVISCIKLAIIDFDKIQK